MNNTKDIRLSVKELAEFIGVSTDTIRRAFRKGEIPAIRVRTALRFDLEEVLLCMQRQGEALYGGEKKFQEPLIACYCYR